MCLRINIAVYYLISFCIPCIQGIMLMRVCAIYGPSRYVHKILKIGFVIEQVAIQSMTFATYRYGPGTYGIESRFYSWSNCNTEIALQDTLFAPWYFVQLTFELMMLSVSLFCLYRHACEVRAHYRRWDWNDLFMTMIRDHTLYFVMYVVWGTMNGTSNLSDSVAPFIREELYNGFNFLLGYIQQYILVPHLVLDMRKRCSVLGDEDVSLNDVSLGTVKFTPAQRSLATIAMTNMRHDHQTSDP